MSENPGGVILFDGHNLSPLAEIGLTDLSKFGDAKGQLISKCLFHFPKFPPKFDRFLP